jgi:hypothetical protein
MLGKMAIAEGRSQMSAEKALINNQNRIHEGCLMILSSGQPQRKIRQKTFG